MLGGGQTVISVPTATHIEKLTTHIEILTTHIEILQNIIGSINFKPAIQYIYTV
jgi:hypothetical protein